MKKILFSLIVLLASVSANAQQTFTWKQYGLSFRVPSNFKVLGNTAENFEAENSNIHLAIELMDYDGVDAETMGEVLGQMANDLGMTGVEVGELVLTSLEGAYIEGKVDGANVCLVLLLDTDSNIALVASVTYANGSEKQATDIVNSFSMK